MNAMITAAADRAEPFNLGVAASVVLHVGLIASLALGGALASSNAEQFGSPHGNGAIRVKITGAPSPGLLLPPRAPINPKVTPSDNPGDRPPQTAKPPKTRTPKPPPAKNVATRPADPRAVRIPGAKALVATAPASAPATAPASAPAPEPAPMPAAPVTAVAVTTPGNAGTSGIPGNGGAPAIPYGRIANGTRATEIDFGEGSFGSRFGWYASRVSEAVAEQFDPPPGTPGRTAAIKFVIARDGTVSDVQFERKSNIEALDNAAKRAIQRAAAANKIPPLPADYRGANLHARLLFESRQ